MTKLHSNGFGAHVIYCVYVGALYPASMRINDLGRLVVNFRTEAHFRGLFVASHRGEMIFFFGKLITVRYKFQRRKSNIQTNKPSQEIVLLHYLTLMKSLWDLFIHFLKVE